MCKVVQSTAGGWMLPVQLVGQRSTESFQLAAGKWMLLVQPVGRRCVERSGWLQASKCCLCSWLARDVHSSPVNCRLVNAACADGWPEKCREVRSTAGEWMLPVQLVGWGCAKWSGRLQAGECCLCSQLAREVQRGPVDCRWVNAACAAGWLEMRRVVWSTAGEWMLSVQPVG